jgi:hypothetical protein
MTSPSRGVAGDIQLYQGAILSGRLIQFRALLFGTALTPPPKESMQAVGEW